MSFGLAVGSAHLEEARPGYDAENHPELAPRDRPMDFADASLVVLCERLGIRDIATLDADFNVYRLNGRDAFHNIF